MKNNLTEVKDKILEARLKQKSYYDKGKTEKYFEEGAYVMLKIFTKSKFVDDYRIGPLKFGQYWRIIII